MEKRITYLVPESAQDLETCQFIITEYLATLGIDLAYMNLPEEFAQMEQMYGESEGVFLLAFDHTEAIGCAGVRKLENGTAELKRLYVRDAYRGYGVGVALLEKVIEHARRLGYRKIRLDVIPTLQKAKKLYLSFGFYEIPPYFNNPVAGTTYMEKLL